MTQQHFFDVFEQRELTPIARNTDPQTSHQAAAELDLNECTKITRSAALTLLSSQPDATAVEIGEAAYAANRSHRMDSYRRRVTDLVKVGVLVECGWRKCSITGKMAATFKEHEHGRANRTVH